MTDSQMLDWLEAFINEHGALILHDGAQRNLHEYSGLGLRPGFLSRTLREAIESAAGACALATRALDGPQDVSGHGEEK